MGLKTEIATLIKTWGETEAKYLGYDKGYGREILPVADQVIAKIREVVEGAKLTKETIQEHCRNVYQKPMTKKELIIADYGAFIQLQAILKAMEED